MSSPEIAAAVLSALGVWLTARRWLVCWPVSLLASLLYGWVFMTARLYADMLLQAVFCAFLIYGWRHWNALPDIRPIEPPRRTAIRDILAGAVGALCWGLALAHWTDDPAPFTDAGLSAYSIVGQFWMARRYRACWLLWIIVDALYVWLFMTRALYPTAALYAGFIVLAADGWRAWRRRTI
ncbi:transporter of nicotinamide mononucleotide PnuC [Neoasaia chiangmaiensis NBRC 101099]|uniref:Nicotinamide riboside transporter PnuC n=1 Tax=Neoasaia chiangmaiensis TaxID=320497 RepID=A0A1U9KRS5_9PROT|nr:nicotinamide riboside transporter PnuC [Neoasaia chiangmaiensis]AQS88409.1 aminotransferase [Neoasaia chiangmaiensis]GBR39322.1 transporter of nicotinamide mononucleotide PnuC [Neoasaia chiangmaiensis NBRC 101099]GEN14524.1 aminotransferase [Neoasaia chiangmaiensis]